MWRHVVSTNRDENSYPHAPEHRKLFISDQFRCAIFLHTNPVTTGTVRKRPVKDISQNVLETDMGDENIKKFKATVKDLKHERRCL